MLEGEVSKRLMGKAEGRINGLKESSEESGNDLTKFSKQDM